MSSLLSTIKRERDDDELETPRFDLELNKVLDLAMHTPKCKKLKTPAQYMYRTLFEEGQNSDITLEVLGHSFHLHRIFLCQSPYFACMFNGAWVEYDKKYIVIDIVDPQITIESLKIVFGSLYNGEITVNPVEIVPILAGATLFQLDGIIDKCREVMIETINPQSVVTYYNAACQYGDVQLQEMCMQWFLVNLMTFYGYSWLCYLRTIPIALMAKLVANPNLFVVKTEFSLYRMLKCWMYMHVHPELVTDPSTEVINAFYSARSGENPYLSTKDGENFISTFEGLRVHYLISRYMNLVEVKRDNIIPRSWLDSAGFTQWNIMLKVIQNECEGPSGEIPDDFFLRNSFRCGIFVNKNRRREWHLFDVHYGMDLVMVTGNGLSLSMKWNHSTKYEQLLSFQMVRRLAFRVTVATLNEQRQILLKQSTTIRFASLKKLQDLILFDKGISIPLIISANILFTSPSDIV